MERSEIMGLVCGRGLKRAKLKVEGDGAICGVGITELPPNTVGRRQQQKMKIREKTKPDMKIREKTKPNDVKEMVVGAGSKEDGMVQSAGEGKKLVTWRLSQELMEYIRTQEVMGIMATETPRPSFLSIPEELFDRKLKRQIAAEFKENREFDAYVLYQYRTKGYAEVQEVVTDDEEV